MISKGREFADQVVTVQAGEGAPRVRRGEEERDLLRGASEIYIECYILMLNVGTVEYYILMLNIIF
jgi:hypothetical protein